MKVICAVAVVLHCAGISVGLLQPLMPHSMAFQRFAVNGTPAVAAQFPSFVFLDLKSANRSSVCGGSLISSEWILTAAHCVKGFTSFTASMGSINKNTSTVTLDATIAVIHPNYTSTNMSNDIALIKLPTNITFDQNIAAAHLPPKTNETFDFAMAQVAGFGRHLNNSTLAPVLQFARSRVVIPNYICTIFYGSKVVVSATMCAFGYPDAKRNGCFINSGAPLLVAKAENNTSWTQIGVASFSANGCASGAPSGYIRTSAYLDWIAENTGIAIL